jgi:GDP-4-dehydro-6-deoxy-D-mannose reductase
MFKVMITGINGFVGQHLVRELTNRDFRIIGVGREDLAHANKKYVSDYIQADLTDKRAVANIALNGIDCVINLAGLAAVGPSFDQPELYRKINVGVFSNIGNRMLEEKISSRLIAISTGTVYDPSQTMPLNENSSLARNGSPYTMTKIEMEKEARRLQRAGLDCVIARPFNHIGPGQGGGFLLPDLDNMIRSAKKSKAAVETGDLTTKRDFTDVRDVVRAYADLTTANLTHNVYNVCSGQSISGEKILSLLMRAEGADELEVRTDPAKIRPNDIRDLYGSFERIKYDTGWHPTITVEQTVSDFVASIKG